MPTPRVRSFARPLPALLVLVLTTGAAAPRQAPTAAIRAANDRLRELLGKTAEDEAARQRIHHQITDELRDLLDIGFLTQRALVDQWDKMTPAQRTDISDTLRAIVEKNYLNQLRDNLEYQVDYVSEEPKDDDMLVRTVIRAQRHGRPSKVSVDYKLHAEGDHWRVFDVITEEVSILQNYRGQFNRIISRDGVDGLINRMKSKLARGAN